MSQGIETLQNRHLHSHGAGKLYVGESAGPMVLSPSIDTALVLHCFSAIKLVLYGLFRKISSNISAPRADAITPIMGDSVLQDLRL